MHTCPIGWPKNKRGGYPEIAKFGHPATATQKPEEAVMDTFPQQGTKSIASSVAAMRQAWLEAVRGSDAERLAALLTDDVVAVHGKTKGQTWQTGISTL